MLVRIIENNKIDAYFMLGWMKYRLASLTPQGRKDIEIFRARKKEKTPPQLIFNNSRSSILPGSAPDPFLLNSAT